MSSVFANHEAYWREKLDPEDRISFLPYSNYLAQPASFTAIRRTLPAEISGRIAAMANGSDHAIYMIVCAAVQLLLFKYTHQDHILTAMPTDRGADRQAPVLSEYVIVKNAIAGNTTFRALLGQMKTSVVEAVRHQQLPFRSMVSHLDFPYASDGMPILNTLVLEANLHSAVSSYPTTADVIFAFERDTDGIGLTVTFDSAKYTPDLIGQSVDHLIRLFSVVLFEPGLEIGPLSLLNAAETERLLRAFNPPQGRYADQTIIDRFQAQAAAAPERTAVFAEGVHLTYRELDERTEALARVLQTNGVGAGQTVCLIAERSVEMITGILAVLKAGGAYVPIDPDYPAERTQFIVNDSGARVLLTQAHLANSLSFSGVRVAIDDPDIYRIDEAKAHFAGEKAGITAPGDLAYVIYTSGTTGKPKGVMIEHRQVLNLIAGLTNRIYADYETPLRLAWLSPYVFDASVKQIFAALLLGHTLYVVPKETARDGEALARYYVHHGIDVSDGTPAHLNLLLRAAPSDAVGLRVRHFLIGGEALSAGIARELRTRWPGYAPRITNVYGPTECCVDATAYHLPEAGDEVNAGSAPIGKPLDNQSVYILDANGNIVPPGVSGELYIGGLNVGRGYLNNAALTQEKFVPDPFAPGQRMYRTGDLARWRPDGQIEYQGRLDDQVKVRGFRIELDEIQAQLLKLPGVREAYVAAREDAGGEVQLYAYYAAERSCPAAELREGLAAQLPAYMIPAYFVPLAHMPLTPNGKIDRKALPLPDEGALAASGSYLAPRTELEAQLARIWQEVLAVPKVGVKDNFFEIGGHSLRAVTLVGRLYQELHVDVPLRTVFRHPSVEALAQAVSQLTASAYVPIPVDGEREYYPVSSAQQRLYILHQLQGAGVSYNMPFALVLEGDVDEARFENALQMLVQRHEALRTGFAPADGEIVQRIEADAALQLETAETSVEGAEAAIRRFIRPFDLAQPPLFRVLRINRGDEPPVVAFDMHHIISDGLTMDLLARDFAALYEGKTLAPLSIQYKDYAVWQQEDEQANKLQQQESFWLDTFRSGIPQLDLPADYARPAEKDFRGAQQQVAASEAMTSALKQLAAATGSTLFVVLLAAYHVFLAKYTGQEETVVGSPVAGRSHPDLERVAGMFVNTLALRGAPSASKTFLQLVQEVKDHTTEALANQDYPFDRLVEKLQAGTDLSRNPLFDVMLTLQNAADPGEAFGSWRAVPYAVAAETAKFDLTLHAFEQADTLEFRLEYATSLFRPETAARMAAHWIQLLESVSSNPEEPLVGITMVNGAEEELLVRGYNQTAANYPRDITVYRLFEEQAERSPEAQAAVFRGDALTYRELNERANRLARTLQKAGLQPGGTAGIMLDRSLELLIAILAVLKTGAAYVPIDPSYAEERIGYILEDAGAQLLLIRQSNDGKNVNPTQFAGLRIDPYDSASYAADGTNLTAGAGPDDLAYIIYTSGTTGRPKGAMITHQGLTNYIWWAHDVYGNREKLDFPLYSSISFDLTVTSIFTPWLTGSRVVVYEGEEKALLLQQVVEDNQVDIIKLTPTHLSLLKQMKLPARPSVRKLIVGGENLSTALAREIHRLFHGQIEIYNEYGPTETVVGCMIHRFDPETDTALSVPIGVPGANVSLYVLDAGQNLAPVGVQGELYIAGDGVARGYRNRPDLTADKFLESPFKPGERMYRSGDMAKRRPDGIIEYIGRIDQQVKIRGHRIELGEIEAALKRHPDVREAVLKAHKPADGNAYLCAYLVTDEIRDVYAWRAFLAPLLPEYMIPSVFIRIDRVPLTPNGKIDDRALSALRGEDPPGAFHTAADGRAGASAPPVTSVEQAIAGIWERLLRLRPIGIHDDFFHIGGDSLLAIKLDIELEKARLKTAPLQVFKHRTIRALAEHYERGGADERGREGESAAHIRRIDNKYLPCRKAQPVSILKQRGVPVELLLYGSLENTGRIEAYFMSGGEKSVWSYPAAVLENHADLALIGVEARITPFQAFDEETEQWIEERLAQGHVVMLPVDRTLLPHDPRFGQRADPSEQNGHTVIVSQYDTALGKVVIWDDGYAYYESFEYENIVLKQAFQQWAADDGYLVGFDHGKAEARLKELHLKYKAWLAQAEDDFTFFDRIPTYAIDGGTDEGVVTNDLRHVLSVLSGSRQLFALFLNHIQYQNEALLEQLDRSVRLGEALQRQVVSYAIAPDADQLEQIRLQSAELKQIEQSILRLLKADPEASQAQLFQQNVTLS